MLPFLSFTCMTCMVGNLHNLKLIKNVQECFNKEKCLMVDMVMLSIINCLFDINALRLFGSMASCIFFPHHLIIAYFPSALRPVMLNSLLN